MDDTLHVSEIDTADYVPGKDEACSAGLCCKNLLILGKRCGLSDQQAITLVDPFMEAYNTKLEVFWEVVESYCEGALKPEEGRNLIERLSKEVLTGNHELFSRHLEQLIDNFSDNILLVDPIHTLSVVMSHPMDAYDVWRPAWEAQEHRGNCPDQKFVDQIEIPKHQPWEFGDISGMGNVPVWYHFDPVDLEQREALREAYEKGFSVQIKISDGQGNTTITDVEVGGDKLDQS